MTISTTLGSFGCGCNSCNDISFNIENGNKFNSTIQNIKIEINENENNNEICISSFQVQFILCK